MTTDLKVGGMTCAACVKRVEKKLAKLDGVTATVNLATGRARVSHPAHVRREELVATVEKAGYTAALPEPPKKNREHQNQQAQGESGEARQERDRLLITALLSVPVLVLSMVPAWQFRNWQWLCFAGNPIAQPTAAAYSNRRTVQPTDHVQDFAMAMSSASLRSVDLPGRSDVIPYFTDERPRCERADAL
ncbi:hypothetical protein GCM10010383_37570 [Streptomyces lomondensis]|uniref:HMA domain-containing protein n=1 Tax=Streptomyces lomondensis TaxID=68229 RepID=A0ABQ2X8F2_9ACTN|nr:hypothetical protein GCM10010383_37570 [Streptomyces lomondensis]